MATPGLLNLTSTILHAITYILLSSAANNITVPSANTAARSLNNVAPPFALLLNKNNRTGPRDNMLNVFGRLSPAPTRDSQNVPNPKLKDSNYAISILKKILPQVFSTTNGNSFAMERELNYYDGQTIASVYVDSHGKPTRCNLIEVNTEDERQKALDEFAYNKRLVQQSNFRVLLGIITACQYIDPPSKSPNNYFRSQHGSDQPTPLVDPTNVWSLTSGILPGTKWCGLGDIARNYDDLGTERKLDKCCRSHDYCPVKVKSFRSGYGLVNWSLYTKSHCQCDSLLYDCLKTSRNPTADVLGNVYFNVIRVQCVEEDDPRECVQRDLTNQKCLVWQPISGQPKRMVFRNAHKEF